MRERLLGDLCCPLSRDPLERVGDELACAGCGRRWPIHGAIPRLVPPDLAAQQRATSRAFGWQWRHFSEQHPEFEAQFLDWVDPLAPDDFRGRRVLDAGCGTGRHARLVAAYGADEIVAMDLSDAVEVAAETLRGLDNAGVVQGDLLRPPFPTAAEGGGFDLVYCIGVLHHLPDPEAGFRSLVRLVRPGGTIAIWVYGHEGNGVVRHVVEPVRRVSTRLPGPVLRGVAWPLGAAFHGIARGVYAPLAGTRLGRRLPLHEYLASVSCFSFRQNYGIVFDQLSAPTAAYLRESEVRRWFDDAGLTDVSVTSRHGNSWRGRGRVVAAESREP